MIISGQTLGFTEWVEKLRSKPLLAALSDFEDRTPGIGAFYDFSVRLFPETTEPLPAFPALHLNFMLKPMRSTNVAPAAINSIGLVSPRTPIAN
jgi:hypothetical protein